MDEDTWKFVWGTVTTTIDAPQASMATDAKRLWNRCPVQRPRALMKLV
jgi:hypothetical protein